MGAFGAAGLRPAFSREYEVGIAIGKRSLFKAEMRRPLTLTKCNPVTPYAAASIKSVDPDANEFSRKDAKSQRRDATPEAG